MALKDGLTKNLFFPPPPPTSLPPFFPFVFFFVPFPAQSFVTVNDDVSTLTSQRGIPTPSSLSSERDPFIQPVLLGSEKSQKSTNILVIPGEK